MWRQQINDLIFIVKTDFLAPEPAVLFTRLFHIDFTCMDSALDHQPSHYLGQEGGHAERLTIEMAALAEGHFIAVQV